MSGPAQLPLHLSYEPRYGREDFMEGPSNRAALKLIDSWPDWPSPLIVLSGPEGSGKTHLVHVWSERVGGSVLQVSDIAEASSRAAQVPLAIDDLAAGAFDEDVLFHLINNVKESRTSLLLTSRKPVTEWELSLADLRSRLRLATPITLGAPDDDLLRRVLVKLFSDRQLILEKPVLDYLLVRMERSLSAAAALVEALDRAALAEGRRITRPMAALVLAAGDDSRTRWRIGNSLSS